MPTYLAVAVNLPNQSGLFHYHLPEGLEGQVKPGHLVEVPFGAQRAQGVVYDFVDQPSVPETRPVIGLVDSQTVLTRAQLALARQMSDTTLAPLGACLQLMLPPGLAQHVDTLYTLREPNPVFKLDGLQLRLVNLLRQRGPLRDRKSVV